jgi:hypothetical protein
LIKKESDLSGNKKSLQLVSLYANQISPAPHS